MVRLPRSDFRVAAALACGLLGASPASAAGFFDDVPAKGYIVVDVSLNAMAAAGGLEPVARLRYVRLPWTRGAATSPGTSGPSARCSLSSTRRARG